MPDDELLRHIEDSLNRADATMLSQAEREMDLKTFIREERIKSDKILNRSLAIVERRTDQLLRESEESRADIRAMTAATWKMVDKMSRWDDE